MKRARRRAGIGAFSLLPALAACNASASQIAAHRTPIAPVAASQVVVSALPSPSPIPAPMWPMSIVTSGNALGVVLDGPSAIAAVVAPSVGDGGYDFNNTQIVRVDTGTLRVTATRRVRHATGLTLGGHSLWVISEETRPDGGVAPLQVFAYDPVTFAPRKSIHLPTPSAVASQFMGHPQVDGTLTDLWALDGDKIIDLNPDAGSIREVIAVPNGQVARTMALQAGGGYLYVSTQDTRGATFLYGLTKATRRFTAPAPLDAVVPGSMAATSTGVWVAEPTGMHGRVDFFSRTNLSRIRAVEPTAGRAVDYNGVNVSLAAGRLWIGDDMGDSLRCADPVSGTAIRDEWLPVAVPVVVSAGRVFATVLTGNGALLAVTPPAACFE